MSLEYIRSQMKVSLRLSITVRSLHKEMFLNHNSASQVLILKGAVILLIRKPFFTDILEACSCMNANS